MLGIRGKFSRRRGGSGSESGPRLCGPVECGGGWRCVCHGGVGTPEGCKRQGEPPMSGMIASDASGLLSPATARQGSVNSVNHAGSR